MHTYVCVCVKDVFWICVLYIHISIFYFWLSMFLLLVGLVKSFRRSHGCLRINSQPNVEKRPQSLKVREAIFVQGFVGVGEIFSHDLTSATIRSYNWS